MAKLTARARVLVVNTGHEMSAFDFRFVFRRGPFVPIIAEELAGVLRTLRAVTTR